MVPTAARRRGRRRASGPSSTTSPRVIQGKADVVELALCACVAEGHLLIEDVPGVGKTSLAKALAASLDCTFGRIQFTPDLLPSDVVGVTVWNRRSATLRVPARPRVRQHRAGRRDQPGLAQDPVGPARGDGRGPGHRRRHHLPPRAAVHGASPRRTPSSTRAPTRCPRASSTASCMRVSVGYPDRGRRAGDPRHPRRPTTRSRDLRPVATAADVAAAGRGRPPVHVAPACRRYLVDLATATPPPPPPRPRHVAPGHARLQRAARARAAAAGPRLRHPRRRQGAGRAGPGPPPARHARGRSWPGRPGPRSCAEVLRPGPRPRRGRTVRRRCSPGRGWLVLAGRGRSLGSPGVSSGWSSSTSLGAAGGRRRAPGRGPGRASSSPRLRIRRSVRTRQPGPRRARRRGSSSTWRQPGGRRTPVLTPRDPSSATGPAPACCLAPLPAGRHGPGRLPPPDRRRGESSVGPLEVERRRPVRPGPADAEAAAARSELTVLPRDRRVVAAAAPAGARARSPAPSTARAWAARATTSTPCAPYVVGDDLRRVHWPSTARSDDLMVRQDERALAGPHHRRARRRARPTPDRVASSGWCRPPPASAAAYWQPAATSSASSPPTAPTPASAPGQAARRQR